MGWGGQEIGAEEATAPVRYPIVWNAARSTCCTSAARACARSRASWAAARSTVARALSEPVDRQPSGRRRKSSVDAFREQIAEWLKQGLSGVRMMELAREDPEHPYGGCGSVWRAAVRRERLSLAARASRRRRADSLRGLAGRIPAGRLG